MARYRQERFDDVIKLITGEAPFVILRREAEVMILSKATVGAKDRLFGADLLWHSAGRTIWSLHTFVCNDDIGFKVLHE